MAEKVRPGHFTFGVNPDMVANSCRQQRSQAALADQTDSPDRFLTAEEAAEFLGGINPRTLVRWAREGQVPALRALEDKTEMIKSRVDWEPLLIPAEAAAYLRIHEKTVIRMARKKQLPALRLGKHWRFRRSDLTAWAAGQVQSAGQLVG